MRRLIFQVAVGEVPAHYEHCMTTVRAYADRIGAEYEVLREPVLRIAPRDSHRSENALRLGYLPIFEKEAALARLGEFNRVAVLDADIAVLPAAPDVFEAAGDADFAAVRERDLPLRPEYQRKVQIYSKDQFSRLKDVHWNWTRAGADFYNMGMMVLSAGVVPLLRGQSPREFIQRQEFERFVNGEGQWRQSTDQTLLNWWVRKSGMSRCNLDWRWNALYSYVRPEALKQGPHFLHFNLASKLPRGGDEIPALIASMS